MKIHPVWTTDPAMVGSSESVAIDPNFAVITKDNGKQVFIDADMLSGLFAVDRSREIACSQADAWTFFNGKGRGRGGIINKIPGIESYRKAGSRYLVILSNPSNDEPFRRHIEDRRKASNRGKKR
jgi:hypothetical protein